MRKNNSVYGGGNIWLNIALVFSLIAMVIFGSIAQAGVTDRSWINVSYGSLPLYFIQNNGQVDEQVKYYEKSRGHATFFMEDGVYIGLHKTGNSESNENNQSIHTIKLSFVDGKV